ncbi:MAG: ROK family protein [Akkermansia sp.]
MTASTIPSIGIDFGGTSIKMGVVKGAEVIAHAPSIATQEYGNPDQLIEAIAQFVNMLRLNHPEVQAIGMGMPGFVNFYQGTVYTLTNVPGWNNVPVRDMLRPPADCPYTWKTTPTAWLMRNGSWAPERKRHLVCLTLGTGVGSGLIVNGELLRGSTCSAGELGQTSIDYRGAWAITATAAP